MPTAQRYQLIDILRGFAIVLMVYFHFSYDLSYFGFIQADFYRDPYWLHLRTVIVSLFLGLVGISLVLAHQHGLNMKRYARRLALLVLFSIVITVNSYYMFPGRTIVMGILHFIAVASVLGLAFVRLYWLSLLLGIGLIVLDWVFQHPFFDQPWIHWLGLMTHKPQTEDYVPLIPWFGVILIGIFVGQSMLRHAAFGKVFSPQWPNALARACAFAGRHSLVIYLLHQPLLFGVLWVVKRG